MLNKTIAIVSFMVLLTGAVFGSSQAAEVKTEEVVTGVDVVIVDKFIRTADNFIILYDASGSMGRPYEDTGMTMIQAAEKALKEKNALLPDLGFNAGLYLYTPW